MARGMSAPLPWLACSEADDFACAAFVWQSIKRRGQGPSRHDPSPRPPGPGRRVPCGHAAHRPDRHRARVGPLARRGPPARQRPRRDAYARPARRSRGRPFRRRRAPRRGRPRRHGLDGQARRAAVALGRVLRAPGSPGARPCDPRRLPHERRPHALPLGGEAAREGLDLMRRVRRLCRLRLSRGCVGSARRHRADGATRCGDGRRDARAAHAPLLVRRHRRLRPSPDRRPHQRRASRRARGAGPRERPRRAARRAGQRRRGLRRLRRGRRDRRDLREALGGRAGSRPVDPAGGPGSADDDRSRPARAGLRRHERAARGVRP